MTNGAWNLKAIGVRPTDHRAGVGQALMVGAEQTLAQKGARVLVVDTASGPEQVAARAFYPALGFVRAGVIV